MKTITIDIRVGFTTDACLQLFFRRDGELFSIDVWSEKTTREDNYFNNKYQMNLIPCDHQFKLELLDEDIIDYENSFIEFGFTGARDRWVGPGVLKKIPLGELISEDKK